MNEKFLELEIGKKTHREPIGFGNHMLIENRTGRRIEKHEMLRFAKSLSLAFEKNGCSENHFKVIINKKNKKSYESLGIDVKGNEFVVDLDMNNMNIFNKGMDFKNQRKYTEKIISNTRLENIRKKTKPDPVFTSRPKTKVLLFRNIFNAHDKEDCDWFSPGAMHLASSLKKEKIPFIVTDSKIGFGNEFITNIDKFESMFKIHPEINVIAITVCEDYFKKVKQLIKFIRTRSKAFIALGGPMPTLTPEHALVHLPEANIIVRGDGEKILPKIAKMLDGMDIDSEMSEEKKEGLLDLKGTLFSNKDILISSKIDEINRITEYDEYILDFSILRKVDVERGLNVFTSRGCNNNCIFCTTIGKGEYVARSFESLKYMLEKYHARLKAIFKDDSIPEAALGISFNDDDFLGDPERAMKIFEHIIETPFHINFFQTGINSFYIRKDGRLTDDLNYELLNSMSEEIFSPGKEGGVINGTHIYIGTENFSDDELKRLGKGYGYEKIERVVMELSKRRIIQTHHFILSNAQTEMGDVMTNLMRIAKLRLKYGRFFNTLFPPVTNLVSLYPSSSYRISSMKNLKDCLVKKGVLRIEDFPEFDYPIIEKDVPRNENVAVISRKYMQFLRKKDNYFRIIDDILFFLLFRAEQLSMKNDIKSKQLAEELYGIIEKNHDYPRIILGSGNFAGSPFENKKCNIQIMITRKCQLRCRYCPVEKSNEEMDIGTLRKSVQFLLDSGQNELRLDFTGGEPLLAYSNLKETIRCARRLAKKSGKKLSFYMITNLLALNQEVAEFLKKENVNLELSIDGDEDTHNYNKAHLDSSLNPYETFSKNIKLIEETDKLAVVVTTPRTVDRLYENFSHIIGLGFRNIELNYALGIFWDEESVKTFFNQLRMIMENYSKEISGGDIRLGNLSKRIEPSILNSEIMVDTDGGIHLLAEWVLNSSIKSEMSFCLGNVRDKPEFSNIFSSRFNSYYIIYKKFTCRSERLKEIVTNNILLGVKTSKFFRGFNEE